MKIILIYDELGQKYQNKIKIIKKGIFWVILNEEAFFISKTLNLQGELRSKRGYPGVQIN